jgi:hypothetical protein
MMEYNGFLVEYDRETQDLINRIQGFIKELTELYKMKIEYNSRNDTEYLKYLEYEYKNEVKPFQDILNDISKTIIPKRIYVEK